MPPENLQREARKYLQLPYSVAVSTDETVGGHLTYVARIREFVGCLAQGDSVSNAVSEVKEAFVDYVAALLEDGLPVPPPHSTVTFTSHVQVSEWPGKHSGRSSNHPTAESVQDLRGGATVELIHA